MWKKVFKIFAILYFPLLVFSSALFIYQKNVQIKNFSLLQERETIMKRKSFIDLFQVPIQNANYWSKLKFPKDFDPLNTHRAFMEPYLEIIKGITPYDQFRFLDLNGKEFFRVQRKGIDSLEFGELQDKSSRSYFKEGIGLKYGQLYLSQINLNRENGKIEKPYKPVIRAVQPIFDGNKKKIGVMVINYKMDRILNQLRTNIVDNNFYLLDDNLNIITSNTYINQIPFEISDSVVPLNQKYGLSGQLFKKDTTFLSNDHIWSVQTLSLNEVLNFGSDTPLEIVAPYHWKVVQELPPKFLLANLKFLYFGIGIFNFITITMLLTIAYFIVNSRQQREKYVNELETKNALLYKKRNLLDKHNKQISNINSRLTIRNKQLSEFNYLVSHNLKAPVTSMSLIVSMINKEQDPQKKIHDLLPKLSQIAESITELTKDMGEYVSIIDDRKVKLEEVDILTLINEVKKDFSKTLLDSNDFKISLILLAWHQVHFSRFYLKSILNILISNAIKYRRDGVSSYIHFETFIENDKKVLVIKDNGIGINLNRHGENVFKLYKRFHRNISGKGIGLFLVKSQLEALDATITIESKENIGTTFKIYF